MHKISIGSRERGPDPKVTSFSSSPFPFLSFLFLCSFSFLYLLLSFFHPPNKGGEKRRYTGREGGRKEEKKIWSWEDGKNGEKYCQWLGLRVQVKVFFPLSLLLPSHHWLCLY